ncbi:uracil-DNA glycosylase family protein [Neomegalonema perideroedes]|uniref:uracil-DNA glycosylase family protein n=1 Tax=Neomegalonema perideroedes TaxID=217219 RepID=UPI00037F4EAC|nr:uracil-DNA glycosylase family protein [Neomegalonema perideroedes]
MAASSLEALLSEIRACRICPDLPLGPRPILQAGAGARILIVGHAPGHIAHERGRPFDDASGRRLRAWLGLTREEFYDPGLVALAPMGFCYPGAGKGGDLPPRPVCAPTWRPRLMAALPEIRLTLALGLFAQKWVLGAHWRGGVAASVEAWREVWPEILPLPHPSGRNNGWLAQRPWVEGEMIPALQERVRGLIRIQKGSP